MKIGKKVKTVPPPERGGKVSKYQPIYNKIDALSDGEFLPLQFEDNESCRKVYLALLSTNRYDVRRRGLTLYVGKQG